MRISVIVPTFNREKFLPACIESLLSQDYPKENYEILIIDNASKDNTFETVREYQSKYGENLIRYVYEAKPGLVHARHCGYKNSRYGILSYTDDDAVLDRKWLSAVDELFESSESPAAVGGPIVIRWDQTPPEWVRDYEFLLGKLSYGNEKFVKKDVFINGGNFHIRKDILKEVGGFNPDQIGDWLVGDGETGLCKKLHKKGYKIGWAPDALMEHCQMISKNATIADIKRRFVNNGRCEIYNLIVADRKGIREIVEYFFQILKNTIRCMRGLLKFYFKDKFSEPRLGFYFMLHFNLAQYSYLIKLYTNPKFRKLVFDSSWFDEI
ncbi:glycosyltransferase family 2 protein [Leptospira gomenensis]|uniref:Glycosyltransferase family 2 protein n=1 Tax=Leptospira gomenensis TaxID=2484974 RepID=A0A5F1YTX5_9LEPT|nr:glycosyltransferase family A protein [Leptospira gomenensis]TGK30912.1 glycosyltransferase family 2 protein [Leptospira gomenensis]TGK32550.1 glycosyltransferase family 2 protein [Leptospira gomenensis]TGK45368.1 glycosyltransferase family 2 protein [Leptospira gomenensis]TGK60640.1 glycosyltransferase family 2 protein [Leptospira gomenensis]